MDLIRGLIVEELTADVRCQTTLKSLNRFKANFFRSSPPFDPSKACYDDRRKNCALYLELFQHNAASVADDLYRFFHPSAGSGTTDWGTKAKAEWEHSIIKSGGRYGTIPDHIARRGTAGPARCPPKESPSGNSTRVSTSLRPHEPTLMTTRLPPVSSLPTTPISRVSVSGSPSQVNSPQHPLTTTTIRTSALAPVPTELGAATGHLKMRRP